MPKQLIMQEFCTQFSTVSAWVSIGWKELPKVNGEGYPDLERICTAVEPNQRHLVNEAGDWFTHAVEIENQQIIKLSKRFKKELVNCKDMRDVKTIWDTKGNGKTKEGKSIRVITSRFDEVIPRCAVSFELKHLCTWALPKSLELSTVAGFYFIGTWFTEAHIEIQGEDSIAAMPFGKKVFIYAAGITASRCLLKSVVDIPSFIALAYNGPPKEWKEKLFFCMPKATRAIAQPSFWAHSVLTSQGPALVIGWEAGLRNKQNRLKTVQYSFARGIGMEVQNAIRQMASGEQDKILPSLPGDAGDCMRAQVEAGLLIPGPSKRSRKKKRFEHLPGPKKRKEKKLRELQGWRSNYFFFGVKLNGFLIVPFITRLLKKLQDEGELASDELENELNT